MMFDEASPQTDDMGNINYKDLIKVMLSEPDPLHLPDHVKL